MGQAMPHRAIGETLDFGSEADRSRSQESLGQSLYLDFFFFFERQGKAGQVKQLKTG